MLSVGFKMETLRKSVTKTSSSFAVKVTEQSNHSFLLFDESGFSDICTITELKELNCVKHMKNVRSSQP